MQKAQQRRKLRQKITFWIALLVFTLCMGYSTFPDFTPSFFTSCRYKKYDNFHPRTFLPLDKLEVNIDETNPDPSHLTIASHAAVACDVPYCSTLGTEILRRGGNAVDAAVTVALCIGSINSFSSGIGGGGFMVVRHPNGTSKAFNFREKAPAKAHKHMYDKVPWLSRFSGLAVAVPGELAGLDAAFHMYTAGKLSWKDLIDPVIKLNRGGFPVEEPLEKALAIALPYLKEQNHENQFDWLFKPDAGFMRPVQQGDTTFRPNFANTLELIAKNGSSAVFYDPEGPIAPHLVNLIKMTGGVMTSQDFADYDVEITDTVKTEFMGRQVITAPNPASGPILILGLNLLNGFKDEIEQKDYSPVATQRLVETMKWMGAGRSQLGDPVDIDNTKHIEMLMTQEWADNLRKNISDDHTNPWEEYQPAYEPADPHGTSHFSIIDENGMSVSMTTTVNLLFGAMLADPVTGIVFNNEMDDFSIPKTKNAFHLEPSIYNYVAPFKRPLSSCVPSIIVNADGHPEMLIGAAGGSRISTAVIQAINRKLRYGDSMLNVIAQPRLHHQLLPDEVSLEFDVPAKAQIELERRKHKTVRERAMTSMNGIYINPKSRLIHAVSDFWRKRGSADGY